MSTSNPRRLRYDVRVLLGYNTNGLTSHRLDDALRLLADEGFQAVAWTPDVGHVDPVNASASEIAAVGTLLDRLGLECVVESGARFVLDPARKHRPNLLESDASERRRRLDLYDRHLDIARDIGAEVFSMWSGTLPPADDAESARARLRHSLSELVDHATLRGLRIGFEPEPGMLIETVEDALALRRELGNPDALGITLDVGHLYVTGEGEPKAIIERLGDLILQVHLEDMKRGIHEHLPPGDGDVDFHEVFGALSDLAYSGPICWELSRSSHAAPEMLRRARECFQHALSETRRA